MNWYLSLTREKQIAIAVLLAHGLLLAMLGADHSMHRTNVECKKITVHTIILETPTKAAPTAISAAAPKPKISIPAPPKQSTVKTESKKQPAQTASTSPQHQNSPTQDHLISEIEKNLKSLAASAPVVKKSNIAIPTFKTPQLQTQSTEHFAVEQIATLLQETLELPEFGEVKISLSINRFGILEKLEILDVKSEKNAEFLKKRLPELQFPCLNESTTLTIVFSNAL